MRAVSAGGIRRATNGSRPLGRGRYGGLRLVSFGAMGILLRLALLRVIPTGRSLINGSGRWIPEALAVPSRP
jgi:hypothetical protein